MRVRACACACVRVCVRVRVRARVRVVRVCCVHVDLVDLWILVDVCMCTPHAYIWAF